MRYKKPITIISTILLISGCTPDEFPKHPNYAIHKPKVKYKACRANLDRMVKQLQGSPYVWAEEGPNNFDCSGFTQWVYRDIGIKIPRVSRDQAKVGSYVSYQNLQKGDNFLFLWILAIESPYDYKEYYIFHISAIIAEF